MIHHIYCDESRQTKDRYMVLGGIIIPQDNVDDFNRTMVKYRADEKMTSELKWSRISNQYQDKYKKFIDYFFALNNNDKIHFKSLIVDTTQLFHRNYGDGKYETSFYKMYYQLLIHKFLKPYYDNEDTKFIICLDDRTSAYSLNEFKKVLNNGLRKEKALPFIADAIRAVEPRNSKYSEVLQINDLIIGAIVFKKMATTF